MNKDLVSYSHAQVRVWVHLSLKTKYCHKVFDNKEFRYAAKNLIIAIFRKEGIDYDRIGLDNNHFHTIIGLGLKSVKEVVKKLKEIFGKKLLDKFLEIREKYFWRSGLWEGLSMYLW